LARDRAHSRDDLDAYALRSHLKAHLAHQSKQFTGEIVPLKRVAEEGRDESPDGDLEADDLADFAAFDDGDGLISPGNVSHRHDGAAMTVIVSEAMWASLGKPRALRLSASAVRAVAPTREALAPVEAMRQLLERADVPVASHLIEMSESSAAQALALLEAFRISDDMLNCAGGAIARGHPGGAASAVLVARLFSSLVRRPKPDAPKHGIAVQGADGGLGVAATFDVV
jgi:acetyl-CoA acetyltransferase